MHDILRDIKVGFQVFVEEGSEERGAVREVAPEGRGEIVMYIENGGDFIVPVSAIRSAHDGKVVLNPVGLDQNLLDAIAHREEPGLAISAAGSVPTTIFPEVRPGIN